MSGRRRSGVLVASGVFLIFGGGATAAAFTLSPVAVAVPNAIAVDYHQPTGTVILSVNYPAGNPFNFELVAADGTQTQFSSASGLQDEVYIAAVRTPHGGFLAGEIFSGTGVPGQVARISSDGSSALIPWTLLPGETGLLRGGLHFDDTGVFGGDLLITTQTGSMWRVDAAGNATNLGSAGVVLEGIITLPNDARYGPWAGKAVSCTETHTGFYAFDPAGSAVTNFDVGIPGCEDLNVIPPNQFFYAVDFGGATLWGAGPDQFAGMVGDIVVGEESGQLWHVRWNPETGVFDRDMLAMVTQFEGAGFAPVRLPGVNRPPTLTCPRAAKVRCEHGQHGTITLTVTLADPDGNPLAVTWTVGGTPTVHQLPAGSTQDSLTIAVPIGTTTVTVAVDDGAGGGATCAIPVIGKRPHRDGDKGDHDRDDDDDDRDDGPRRHQHQPYGPR